MLKIEIMKGSKPMAKSTLTKAERTQKIVLMLDGVETIGKEVFESLSQHGYQSHIDEYVQSAVLMFGPKSYRTYLSVSVLWQRGFDEDAYILVRSLMEACMQLRYLSEDPKIRAKLFEQSEAVGTYRYYEGINKVAPETGKHLRAMTENFAKMVAGYELHKDKFPKKNLGWHGKTIKELAIAVDMEKLYASVYWEMCQLSHSNSTSGKRFFNVVEAGAVITIGPGQKYLFRPAHLACIFLTEILFDMSKLLELPNIDEKIARANALIKSTELKLEGYF